MKLLPRHRLIVPIVAVAIAAAALAWYVVPSSAASEGEAVVANVKSGEFKVVVTTAGELRARKFVQIQGPANAQQAEIWQMKLSSIVPEGTVVKEGDMVAELDRSGIAAKLQEVSLAFQKAEALYTQAMLDSALNLSQAREDQRNLEFALEEKRIAKEQASYEAPSIKRQAEIDLEKAQRAFEQSKRNYVTKREQAIAKMREVGSDVERQRNRLNVVQTVLQAFTIRAPAPGMVIYVREWNGRKKTAGSQVTPWDPTVATLPDLKEMESVTYVNEIDVRKIQTGQSVVLTLDADPSKKLTGKVTSVANVGEQRPNADAKVFEVKINVEQADTTLLPGMTTANAVETFTLASALYVPLESVTIEGEVPYVYKRDGGRVIKQQVETGVMNENEIVVTRGLEKDDKVLLSPPADKDELEVARLPEQPGTKPTVTSGPGDTATQRTLPAGGAAPTGGAVPPPPR